MDPEPSYKWSYSPCKIAENNQETEVFRNPTFLRVKKHPIYNFPIRVYLFDPGFNSRRFHWKSWIQKGVQVFYKTPFLGVPVEIPEMPANVQMTCKFLGEFQILFRIWSMNSAVSGQELFFFPCSVQDTKNWHALGCLATLEE